MERECLPRYSGLDAKSNGVFMLDGVDRTTGSKRARKQAVVIPREGYPWTRSSLLHSANCSFFDE